jgi:hypothetical protein
MAGSAALWLALLLILLWRGARLNHTGTQRRNARNTPDERRETS